MLTPSSFYLYKWNFHMIPYTTGKSCKHLEIVLKTVERCNINCSYCYFFNGGNETYKFHPPYITQETLLNIAHFLRQGCQELFPEKIEIIFHGGEPLMQKKAQFDEMCLLFSNALSKKTELTFALQTNAMLVDQEWIDLFAKHRVGIGVSLDGPKFYNDLHRVDHRNRGTYDRVIKGLTRLNQAAELNQIGKIGLIGVINPEFDPKILYRHFVDDLKMHHMNFLLPDFTHDTFHGTVESYGKFLCTLFDEWAKDDNPDIEIKIIKSVFSLLNSGFSETKQDEIPGNVILVIGSNGDIAPDDVLRVTHVWDRQEEVNVKNISLKDYLASPLLDKLRDAENTCPEICKNCCWGNVCKGGMLIHRHSKKNTFNNPSVYCEAIKDFYSHITAYLLENGIPFSNFYNALLTGQE